ncbi:MAG TPA: rhamnulokinase family protein, partial [Blastocatellia bacterium]|nr:rhamnulokinase family protein [Blastocatellia bacterium]
LLRLVFFPLPTPHSPFPTSHSPMNDSLYIAVDLGAGSGRVFLVGLAPGELLLEEAYRFHYPPARRQGHLRWDLHGIFADIKAGMYLARERAWRLGRPVVSVGVDSWGVDYGLIDADGNLVEDPICYRDERTAGVMEQVFERTPRAEIFARTGIQFLAFNTIFQLFAHARSGIPARAAKMLLIPDLINFLLTSRVVTEYTNATTTQMIEAETGAWDHTLIEGLGLPSRLQAEIVPAGADLGPLNLELAEELNLKGVRVVAPATHDTGSAVAGAPLEDGWAYVSSGTWSLVGVELDRTLINPEVARHNFTNEGGAFGTIRFLKNVMGLWILESCRREWRERGLEVDYDVLLARASTGRDSTALIYPDDERLFNPPSMTAAIARQLAETGQAVDDDPAALTATILDSLALRYASIIRTIETLIGKPVSGAQIVGGGSQNQYLNQAAANASQKVVIAGPAEATVIGNALVQAVAAGRFATLAEARRHVASNISPRRFDPQPSAEWEEKACRYMEIEARFAKS